MNILAVGAHPDDIEFGCAHALIQEVRKGNRVKLLVLSRGEAGSNGTPEAREVRSSRRREADRRRNRLPGFRRRLPLCCARPKTPSN